MVRYNNNRGGWNNTLLKPRVRVRVRVKVREIENSRFPRKHVS